MLIRLVGLFPAQRLCAPVWVIRFDPVMPRTESIAYARDSPELCLIARLWMKLADQGAAARAPLGFD